MSRRPASPALIALRFGALLLASTTGLSAQAASDPTPGAASAPPGSGAGSTQVMNPAVVPGEPEIIMPQVILRIEDLSV